MHKNIWRIVPELFYELNFIIFSSTDEKKWLQFFFKGKF